MGNTKRKPSTPEVTPVEHPLHPAAEHVLRVGLRRAVAMLRTGHREEAVLALGVAAYTADMIDQDGPG